MINALKFKFHKRASVSQRLLKPSNAFSSVVLCLFTVVVITGCAEKLSNDELLERAKQALVNGDIAATEIDLKTLLRSEPENPGARSLYGDLYLRQMNPVTAVEQYDRSLAAYEDPSVRLKLAKALPRAGDNVRLVDDWEAGRYITIETNPEFQAALSLGLLGESRPDDARAAIARALASTEAGSDYVEVTSTMVSLQLDRDVEAARSRLEAVVARDPANAKAQSLLGTLATLDKDFEAAEAYFAAAVDANPYRLSDQLQLVEAQIRLGKRNAADGNLGRLEGALPRNVSVAMLRGQLLFDEGEYEQAVDVFNQVLSQQPNQLAAILLAANSNLRLGKLSVARRHFEDFLLFRPGDSSISLQLAQVYSLQRESDKAERLARDVLSAEPANEAAMQVLANSLAAQGRHVESAEVLQELTSMAPESTQTRVALGSQQLIAGEVDAGLQELDAAVSADPQSVLAHERLIEAQLALGDLPAASIAAESYVDSFPDSARALVFLGRVRLQEQQYGLAKEQFDQALKLDPENIAALGGVAALKILEGDLDAAVAVFKQALAAKPGDLVVSMNLAVLLEQQGKLDEMVSVLIDAIDAYPLALQPRLALARLALREGEPGLALDRLQPIIERYQQDPRLHRVLASTYLGLRDLDKARSSSDRLLELLPNNVDALVLGARVALRAGDPSAAEVMVERALEINSDSDDVRLVAIDVSVMQRRWTQAVDLIEALPVELQQSAAVQLLRGRIALRLQELEQAQGYFAKAFESTPSSEAVVLLAVTEWELGNQEAALQRLEAWISDNPDDAGVRNEYASRLLVSGDEAAAIKQYEALIALAPDSPSALNNLAWLLREVDGTRALEFAARADELAPQSAQIKDTYAMVEFAQGEFDRALLLNERALELSEDQADIALNRAKILIGAGRTSEATAHLESLMQDSDFGLMAEAQALLDQL